MNQEQNNLNQNNFNTQGNNGIPNNQPLNNMNQNYNNTFNQSQNLQQNFSQPEQNYQPSTPNPIPSKKLNLGLIIGIIAVVVAIGVGAFMLLNNNDNNPNESGNNNSNNKTENNNVIAEDFYVISGSTDKGSLAMATNFESKSVDEYNYIEKYNMKWITEGELFITTIPTIPNRTYSINSYYQNEIQMNSDNLDLNYYIYNSNEFDGSKAKVETLLQNSINEYSGDSYYKLNKNTEVIEENGVIGYAFSIKTVYSSQVRLWYYTKLDNKISNNTYYLAGFVSFDSNNYDAVKPILEELGKTINFNITTLVDQVR